MKKFEEIDKNFALCKELSRKDVSVYNAFEAPFSVHGLIVPEKDGDSYRRLPVEVADSLADKNASILELSKQTAGGRIRFATDSDYIAIHAELNTVVKLPKMAITGSTGFDLYKTENGVQNHVKTFTPPMDVEDSFEDEYTTVNDCVKGLCDEESGFREYTLNFPLYCGVTKLYIILSKDAKVRKCSDYKYSNPVLYYGSSITQGGCASRPGCSYQSIISRKLDCDYINLGFAGGAKGEQEIAEYIAKQNMSVFVYDYDYNAATLEDLERTHESFYLTVRKAKPNLPIICVSKPCFLLVEEWTVKRCEIIERTVNRAKAAGDENIYYICGMNFCPDRKDASDMLVDCCHPNDWGFRLMADKIGEVVEKVIKK